MRTMRASSSGTRSLATSGVSDVGELMPRMGDGPLEVEADQHGCTVRIPVVGGGRLVVVLDAREARNLGGMLVTVSG